MDMEIEYNKAYIYYGDAPVAWLHIISVKANPTATITRQPLETGIPVADHKYMNPNSVTMSVVVEENDWEHAKETLQEMYEAPLWDPVYNKRNTFDIYLKGAMKYSNMVLVSMPHENNTSDKFNNYYFDLAFQEVLWVDAQEVEVKVRFASQPALTSNSNVGQVATQEVN